VLVLLLLLLVCCIGLVARSRALWLVVLLLVLLLLLSRLLPCLSMVWLLLLLLLLAVALLCTLHVGWSLRHVLREATTTVSSSSKVRRWCCKPSSVTGAPTQPTDGSTTVRYCMGMRGHRHLLGLIMLPLLLLLLLWRLLLPPVRAGSSSSSSTSRSCRSCSCWCNGLCLFHDHCSTTQSSNGTKQRQSHMAGTDLVHAV
jgi:hypothetical protein